MELNSKRVKILEGIIGILSIIAISLFYYQRFGAFYLESPDANIYYSVSDNFFSTGHFIQNAYPEMKGFVVPWGLPLIILCLKLFINNRLFVVAVQYIMFGVSNILVYRVTTRLFKSDLSGCLSTVIYIYSIMNNHVCGPAYILTENYFLLAILIISYLIVEMSEENCSRNILLILLTSFLGMVIRPLLTSLFFIALGTATIICIRKRKVKHFLFISAFCFLSLVSNLLINYRETKEWVLLENYSGVAVYQANNPNTKTSSFSSALYPEFMDDYGISIRENTELTTSEKQRLYGQATRKYIINNTGKVIYNAMVKYYKMFVQYWGISFYIAIIVFLYYEISEKRKDYRLKMLSLFVIFWVLSTITAFGLNISRYSIVALPFYALTKGGIWGCIILKLSELLKLVGKSYSEGV